MTFKTFRTALTNAGLALLVALSMSSCVTGSGGAGSGSASGSVFGSNHPAVKERNARIAREPRGDYFIGRRYWTEGTRFWGYLRRPGQPWSESKLVIMDESIQTQPDRVPEVGSNFTHGFDHNWEYKIWGSSTGQKVYDPNSNFILPEFRLSRYELVTKNPGFLFSPGETYSRRRLPPKHPPIPR